MGHVVFFQICFLNRIRSCFLQHWSVSPAWKVSRFTIAICGESAIAGSCTWAGCPRGTRANCATAPRIDHLLSTQEMCSHSHMQKRYPMQQCTQCNTWSSSVGKVLRWSMLLFRWRMSRSNKTDKRNWRQTQRALLVLFNPQWCHTEDCPYTIALK